MLIGAFLALSAPGNAAAGRSARILPITRIARPVPFPRPFTNFAAAHLTYYGGPVMPFTENAIVLWGSTGHTTALTTALPSFLTDFANSGNGNPYNIALEYHTQGLSGSTTNQPLTIGSRYLGAYTITPSTSSTNLTDAQVSAELKAQIAAGHLPAPRASFGGPVTEYYVMFPAADSICMGSSCSDVQFCAYHSNATYGAASIPFTYAILPESTPPDSGCGPSLGVGNLTSMTSHEMVESMTDSEVGSATTFGPPLAWYDATNGEIGDICNGEQATVTLGADTWTVQKQWSNTLNSCVSTDANLQGVAATFSTSSSGVPLGFNASATTSPNGTHTITNYAWDWGDGSSSSGSSATTTHAYASAGTRVVTMIATDASGATGVKFLSLTTRQLTVSAANGSVTSSPTGVSCGATCSANFLDGASVTLNETPATGYVFTGWSGDCSGTSTCVVTMSATRNVTATFAPAATSYLLTVAKAGTGTGTVTSSPAGISCGATCTHSYSSGTVVVLTAAPATGSTFAGWSACSGTGTCSVTMSSAKSVTATFNVSPPPPPPPPPPPTPPPPPPPPPTCVVPGVSGLTVAAAGTALTTAHCALGTVTSATSKTIPKGLIISQTPAAGSQGSNGEAVNVVVSSGAPKKPPAKLITLCYRHHTVHVSKAAAKKLRKHGAKLGKCKVVKKRP